MISEKRSLVLFALEEIISLLRSSEIEECDVIQSFYSKQAHVPGTDPDEG